MTAITADCKYGEKEIRSQPRSMPLVFIIFARNVFRKFRCQTRRRCCVRKKK